MENQAKFIVTTKKDIADKFLANGFKLISNNSGTYTFVNEPIERMNFDADIKKNIVFTNMLSL